MTTKNLSSATLVDCVSRGVDREERARLALKRSGKRRGVVKTQWSSIRRSSIQPIVFVVATLVGGSALLPHATVAGELRVNVDWSEFLARHDLVWDRLATTWYESPFLGNGMMGTMIYRPRRGHLRWDVHRSDVQDHRDNTHGWSAYSRGRLPIGYFDLVSVGQVDSGTMHLDLYNAEARGVLRTDVGEIAWRSVVLTGEMAIVIETRATEGERDFTWRFHPAEAISPRQAFRADYTLEHRHQMEYKHNPPHALELASDGGLCSQPLLVGGGHATAWRQVRLGPGHRLLYVSVDQSFPKTDYAAKARRLLERALATPFEHAVAVHRDWWHRFYPASFLSIPDTRLEGFYWIQMYKLAAATRADGALIDNHGPWLEFTKWPYACWNLNVQLTYWPCYASNRLELGESLCRSLDRNFGNLIENVPEAYRHDSAGIGRAATNDCIAKVGVPGRTDVGQYSVPEVGLLPWACHNYYLQYRYSMDDKLLRERLFPLMRRAFNYYLHFLEEGSDGRLHLPATYCPEYGLAPDNNFDLGLMRWGFETLLQICERLGMDDPLAPGWRDVLERLVDYPVDENGLMVGRGVPWAKSHRHYSHMLMVYPFYLLNREDPKAKRLIERTLDHWLHIGGGSHHRGYSYTGPASMYAALGDGDRAHHFVNKLLDSEAQEAFGGKWIRPNTMYMESGPVIETPLSAAQSLHDMLIQSWGGKIRVFPALPVVWKDVTIHNLRTEGAFLVSAVRRDGRTEFVRVKSLAGEPCRVVTGMFGRHRILGKSAAALHERADGSLELDLARGDDIILYTGPQPPRLEVTPLAAVREERNYYGLHR